MPHAIEIAVAWAIVIGTFGVVATAVTVARARLRGSRPAAGDGPGVAELRESIQQLSADLADLQERVDFAERLLARQREAERLRGPS